MTKHHEVSSEEIAELLAAEITALVLSAKSRAGEVKRVMAVVRNDNLFYRLTAGGTQQDFARLADAVESYNEV